MSRLITIGVDIGQKSEPSAICVAEIESRKQGHDHWADHFVIRHLERQPLGTSFPAIAARLSEISRGIRRRFAEHPSVFVDATGLGQPLVDLLEDEPGGLGPITPVYFNHGDQRTHERGKLLLGKAYLVSRLQMLLQTARLHLPRTEGSERLAAELLDYEIQVDEKANERYGAFNVGSQDDLVTALGLAVNEAPRRLDIY